MSEEVRVSACEECPDPKEEEEILHGSPRPSATDREGPRSVEKVSAVVLSSREALEDAWAVSDRIETAMALRLSGISDPPRKPKREAAYWSGVWSILDALRDGRLYADEEGRIHIGPRP